MGYRELHRMEIEEVVRRWQAHESQRAIARATGLARATVKKYLDGAVGLGLEGGGPPPTEAALAAPRLAALAPYTAQIATWLREERLQLTRVQELLDQRGVSVRYTTLRRFVRRVGLGKPARSTVRMAETAPGDIAELDFERLGALVDPRTG